MSTSSHDTFYTIQTPKNGRGGHSMDLALVHDKYLPELWENGFHDVAELFPEPDLRQSHMRLLGEVTAPFDKIVDAALANKYHGHPKPAGWRK